jgi:hypothetical protein
MRSTPACASREHDFGVTGGFARRFLHWLACAVLIGTAYRLSRLCRTEIRFRHLACGSSRPLGSYLILTREASEYGSSADARRIQVDDRGDLLVGVVVRDAESLVRALCVPRLLSVQVERRCHARRPEVWCGCDLPRVGTTTPARWQPVLMRLAYLAVSNAFAVLRLLPISDREKDVEILALRHQLTVLQRQLGTARPAFNPADRTLLAALLTPLPRTALRRLQLIVRPDTVLRWHRDLISRRHAALSKRKHPGRPRTVASIRRLILRLVDESPGWGYRRVHGELAMLGIKVAASTVWEILKDASIDRTPERATTTWSAFLRSQADAILACDFRETVTLGRQRQYVLAVIEHATRRIRVLGATAHPTAA